MTVGMQGSDQPGDDGRVGFSVELPTWVDELAGRSGLRTDPAEQMALVLELAAANIEDGGGPFAAVVFDADGRPVGPGVNRVVPSSAPVAHAEIVAIAVAGRRLGTWDLGAAGALTLVSSTEPCAMCLGAVPWSGVSRLVTGARDGDARAVGFDEGDKPERWEANLAARGIEVLRDVARDRAVQLLQDYARGGGRIYNG